MAARTRGWVVVVVVVVVGRCLEGHREGQEGTSKGLGDSALCVSLVVSLKRNVDRTKTFPFFFPEQTRTNICDTYGRCNYALQQKACNLHKMETLQVAATERRQKKTRSNCYS
jgi:hypothetical protein